MQASTARPYRNIGFFFIALLLLVLAGFTPRVPGTPFFGYFSRVASGGQVAAVIHAHAAIAVAWFGLLCTQPFLVRAGRVGAHRWLGWASVVLVAAFLVTGVLVTRRAFGHALLAVPRETALALLSQQFTVLVLFTTGYVLALVNRRRLHRHVAFLVGASLAAATPGLARLGLFVAGGPLGILAVMLGIYGTLLCFMVYAKRRWRQPVLKSPYLVLLALFVAAHALDLAGSRTAAWRWFAGRLVSGW